MNTYQDSPQQPDSRPADPFRFAPCQPRTQAEAVERDGAVFLSEVAEAGLKWLWPGRIPLGSVTVLIGDPGLGKSLIALDVAARLTRGAPWPDHQIQSDTKGERLGETGADSSISMSPPLPVSPSPSSRASVLLLNPEDRLAETVRPRLEALGADCSQVVVQSSLLDMVTPHPNGTLLDGVGDFFRAMRLLGSLPNCRLLIVDPINAYFSGVNPQRVLLSLQEIADRRGVAVLVVSHVRKKGGAAIHRALGSLALVTVARAVWVIAKDPANDRRRLLLPIKNNLAEASGLAYTIVSNSRGEPIIEWSPEPVELSADDVFARGGWQISQPEQDRRYATKWLSSRLASGPCPSKQVLEEAREHGITPYQVRRAFRELGGEAFRTGFGPTGHWVWQLPALSNPPRP